MSLSELIRERFGLPTAGGCSLPASETLMGIVSRRSCRRFSTSPVADGLIETLFAAAFSAPSKSDLQQACVIRVVDPAKQQRIAALTHCTRWIAEAPVFMVWCGDSRRIRRLAEWRSHPFANDHLDAFMNAAVDAGIVMQTFILAAESVGLGCCPISEIRDQIELLSAELGLPEWVFPVAGLCLGGPAGQGRVSMRLPLSVTVHRDRYDDSELFKHVADYDRRREERDQTSPEEQRLVEQFGVSDEYGWSENRTRQYAVSMRSDFGRYVRKQGFNLS